MARRSTPYLLDLGSDQETELSLSEWNELLSGAWIEPTGYKTARPRRGVVAWIRGGDLFLAPLAHMPCVTAGWFLIWLFHVTVMSAGQSQEIRAVNREWALLDRERERQNEALIWRARRNTKGKNEFRYIPADRKAEYFRALKPELLREVA